MKSYLMVLTLLIVYLQATRGDDSGQSLEAQEENDISYDLLTSSCGGDFASETGFINYPGTGFYPNNVKCVWNLVTTGRELFKLTFKKFDIEDSDDCSKDYLEIKTFFGGSYVTSIRMCGDRLPNPIITRDNTISLTFKSNGNNRGNGFRVEWETVKTKCEAMGGYCRSQWRGCCPEKMDTDTSLCHGSEIRVCCLPASVRNTTSGPGGPSTTPGPIVGPSPCTECSQKHQEVLQYIVDENSFELAGTTLYDPAQQVPIGKLNQQCLPRGPACPGGNTCLRNRVLNLLTCAPRACKNINIHRWRLLSLLRSDANFGNEQYNLCNGKAVLFEKIHVKCDTSNLQTMCEDTGGVFVQDGDFLWCDYN